MSTPTVDSAVNVLADPSAYADEPRLHAALGHLRSHAPVAWVDRPPYRPFWAIAKHADIMEIERASNRWISEPRPLLATAALDDLTHAQQQAGMAPRTLVHMDDPLHRVMRAIGADWFRPKAMRDLKIRVDELAKIHVDKMRDAGNECDFVQEIAVNYPLYVIMSLLGLPESDFPSMLKLTQEVFGADDDEYMRGTTPEEQLSVLLDFFAYFNDLTESRRRAPTEDLASAIANARIDGEPLSPVDAVGYYTIVATAGHDTTSATIAGGLRALIDNPAERKRLCDRPELMGTATEEMIRWVTPVKEFMRTATEDTTVRGVPIAAGESVYLAYVSGNRDEEVFDDPFRFDVGRDPNKHLAFGFGVHFCLGAALARMEVKSFFTELLPRLKSIEYRATRTCCHHLRRRAQAPTDPLRAVELGICLRPSARTTTTKLEETDMTRTMVDSASAQQKARRIDSQSRYLGERAVVLGASMGGLLAARVLADFFRTVTVIERDELPDGPVNRRGVPQGRHVHALLARGAQILEELFPGFLDELVAAGAPVWDDGELSKVYVSFSGHELPRTGTIAGDHKAMAIHVPSRQLLECHVRRRVQAMENVTIHGGHDVAELTAAADRSRVTGVRIVNRAGGAQRELAADLVVDAMGRGAHTPALLENLGYGRPVEDHIVMHTTYVSQPLRIPPGTLQEKVSLISPAPGRPTGMFLNGYEHDTWIFTVFGMVRHDPPRDLEGMLSFAEDYAPAHLLAAVRAGEPLGPVVEHRVPSSQWRRYDKMRRLPDGLVVCGDAICSFNPIYGQGMAVAALDALALRDCLRRGVTDLPRRYFRAAAKAIAVAWQIGATDDLAIPGVEGRRTSSMRVTSRLVDLVLTACESDAVVATQFFKVAWLIDSPIRLLRPSFLYRVITVNFGRRQRHSPPRRFAVRRNRSKTKEEAACTL